MKALISLVGAAFLLAGCHSSHHRGGSYSDYPYHHQGHYDSRYDRNYGYYDSQGRYHRNYGYYDRNGRYVPYDRDGNYRYRY